MHSLKAWPKASHAPTAQQIAAKYLQLESAKHRRHVDHLLDDLLRAEAPDAALGKPPGKESEE